MTSSRSAPSCSSAAWAAHCASGGTHDSDVLIILPMVSTSRTPLTA
jgi:hypothetical protein